MSVPRMQGVGELFTPSDTEFMWVEIFLREDPNQSSLKTSSKAKGNCFLNIQASIRLYNYLHEITPVIYYLL